MNKTIILCQDKYEAQKLSNFIFNKDGKDTFISEILNVVGNEIIVSLKDKSAHSIIVKDNQEVELPVGTIYLDSNHSPVSRINYEIENSRVDQKTDYDRLNFELWTNGSVKPADSLAYAAKIIKEHMEVFINFDESSIKDEPEDEVEDEPLNENLYRSVSELELSVRSINCLQNAKIETIGDLVQKTEQEMLKTKNFGRKSLNEIKVILTDMGLALGTTLEKFDPANNPHEK